MNLAYESHAMNGNLLNIIKESRKRDRIMGYSLRGIHKDDLVMQLGDFPTVSYTHQARGHYCCKE